MTTLNHHRRGTGEPLLLVHGIGSRWQSWTPVLARLETERDVIAVDLPGYGASPPRRPGAPPGIASLTDALEVLLDELGLEEAHVGGNSLGGRLALELARRGRARSVTAISPAGFYNDREAAFMRASLLGSMRLARLMEPVAAPLLSNPVVRSVLLAQLMSRPWRIPARAAIAETRAFAGATGFEADLASVATDRFSGGGGIDVPILIVWGRHDRLLIPRQGRRAARAIPHARLVTPAVGHTPTYDDPGLVAELLLAGSRP